MHGQAEIVSDKTGIRVAVTTPGQVAADLARAVEWMAAHPAERLTMGRQAFEFALTQLWETKIRLFVDEWYPAMLLKGDSEPIEGTDFAHQTTTTSPVSENKGMGAH